MNDKIKDKIEKLKTLNITHDIQKTFDVIYKVRTNGGLPNNDFIFYITNKNGQIWYDLTDSERNGIQYFYSHEIVYIVLFSYLNDKKSIEYIVNNSNDFDNKIITLFKKSNHLFIKNKKILDLGAHQGFYAMSFSKYFRNVISVEPFPQNYLTIELNILENNIDNIIVDTSFISNSNKQGHLSHAQQKYIKNNYEFEECIINSSKIIDQFIEFNPDTIKIDIEGEELSSLKGANKMIEKYPNIFIELHKELDIDNTTDYNNIKNILKFKKYTVVGMKLKSNELIFVDEHFDINTLKYIFFIKSI